MDTEKALKQFGLNQKQAQIYLATLELGSAPVNKIAKKAGIPRSSSYDVLEELVKMGVASQMTKKKIKYFAVEDPKKIVNLAKQRADALESALPGLNAIYGLAKKRPQVRFFQGLESLKQIFEEIVEDGKELLTFGSADDLFTAMGEYHFNFVKRRVKKKIFVRAIVRDTKKARERQTIGSKELREIRLVSDNYPYQGLTFIFGNKIAFISFINEYVSVVIESKELTDIQRAMFEHLWDSAK